MPSDVLIQDDDQGGNDKADQRRQREPAVTDGEQIGNISLAKARCRLYSDDKKVRYHRHDKAKQQPDDNADQQPCNGRSWPMMFRLRFDQPSALPGGGEVERGAPAGSGALNWSSLMRLTLLLI